MKNIECMLTMLAQTTFKIDADPDTPEFDEEIDRKRDALVKNLEEMGFNVDVVSEELE